METKIVASATRQTESADLPTVWGSFHAIGFEREVFGRSGKKTEIALALTCGDINSAPPILRIHSQCTTGEVFGSLRCDCGEQLQLAMRTIQEKGAGVLIYEAQEGRGIGLMAKLRAYSLQDFGSDTAEANQLLGFPVDCRDYGLPVEIVHQLGLTKVKLLSNNPMKYKALVEGGIQVVQRIPCEVAPNPHAMRYMLTKKRKMGHELTLV